MWSPKSLLVGCLAAALAGGAGPLSETGETRELRPGEVVERELAGGEAHVWRFEAAAGRPLLVTVEQRGSDVAVQASSPHGESAPVVDTPTGRDGPESLLVEPTAPGAWRLEVRSPAKAAAPGRYEIRLEALDLSSPGGRRRIEAERLMTEAAQLYGGGTADSRRQAVERYAAALPLWRELNNTEREADALFCLGALHRSLGDAQKALEAYERALPLWRGLGRRDRETDTLNRLGLSRSALGRQAEALTLFQQALELARRAGERGDGYREAEALANIGFIQHSRGELRQALESYGQALERFRAAGDPWQEATVLKNLGGAWDRLGEPQQSLDHSRRALELARTLGDRAGEAGILANLAVTHREIGEMGEALARYDEALAVFRELGDRRWQGRILNNIGFAYLLLGEAGRAVPYYDESLELRRATGDRLGEAITLNNLGRARGLLGETGPALDLHRRALALARELGDRQEEANALALLGQARAVAGDAGGGLEDLGRAVGLLRTVEDRRSLARILQRTGEIQARKGDLPAALASFEQALALRRAMADRAGAAETLDALARAERAAGRPGTAKARIEEALGIIESLRGAVESPDLRASFLASQRRAYELYVDLLMELDSREPGRGWTRAALEASERSRARSLLELLHEAGTDVREGVDPELRERERSLRQRLNAKALRRLELLSRAHSREQVAAMEKEMADLLAEVDRLEAEIRRRSPRYAALTQPQPLTAAEVQALLGRDTLLLEYALGDDRSFLWAVDSQGIAGFPLPGRSVLDAAAREVYRHLRTIDAQAGPAESEALAALARTLLGPVADRLPGKRLVIVADGALQYLPFAALPSPVSGDPLLLTHEVVRLPSASVLALQRRETRDPAPATLAILADPVFSPTDPRVGGGRGPSGPAQATSSPGAHTKEPSRAGPGLEPEVVFDRLPATRREAESIAALAAPAEVLTALDFRASRQTALTGGLERYRLVHFATHGVIHAETPELSGLALSMVSEDGRPEDGFLGLRDIYNLRLRADLVVLSGCETALGREIRGEGLTGLARGFMYAGAARVVASLWRVQDRATAELMTLFYRGLLVDRLPPAAALRRAQLAIRAERRWRDPYHWAPFVLLGDWD